MLIEWDRQGTDKATPTLALIEITFTPTGDGTAVVEVQLSGLSAEDAALYPQLLERCLDLIAAACAVAEPGALPGNRVRDPASDANLRLARSTPCNPPATKWSRAAPGAKTHDVAEIGLSLVIDGGMRLVVEDGLDMSVLVRAAVVKLRSAEFRRDLDVFEGGASHAAPMD